jgi:protein-disulfide isomerase
VSTGGADLAVPVGEDDHVLGADDAAITLVEYGDYECPYCGEAYVVVKELQRALASDLRMVFRNLPLVNVHPHAELAAEAAEAVGLQGKFWAMHDLLYEHQSELAERSLLGYAKEAGADETKVADALTRGEMRRRVADDLEGGIRSGVNGTPTFFVNGVRYDASWALEPFAEYLQQVLDQV